MINVTGYTGTHTLTFRAVCTDSQISASATVYLDNIGDFQDGTSGPAPLTVQFADLSTKMENPVSRSWKWEYKNATVDWNQFATARNPSYKFTADGSYDIRLTVTTAVGSDSETKTGYITVGTAPLTTSCQLFGKYYIRDGTPHRSVQ